MNNDEYRNQLLTKLNALLAVLEVAITKIEKSMSLPDSDEERLEKILVNLNNTRDICLRATHTLKKGSKQSSNFDASVEYPFLAVPSGAREYTEMSSVEEYRKF